MIKRAAECELDKDDSWMEIKEFPEEIISSRPALNSALKYLSEKGFVEKSTVTVMPFGVQKNIFRLTDIGYEFTRIFCSLVTGEEYEA